MAAVYHSSTHGFLFYNPTPPRDPKRPPALFRSRRFWPGRVHVKAVSEAESAPTPSNQTTTRRISRKVSNLAISREHAKRILRSVIAHSNNQATAEHPPGNQQTNGKRTSWKPVKRTQTGGSSDGDADDTSADMRPNTRPSISGPTNARVARPTLAHDVTSGSTTSDSSWTTSNSLSTATTASSTNSDSSLHFNSEDEKPIAVGNGVSVAIHLAEPVLFLQGFENSENTSTPHTAMLRGSLNVRVLKAAKIKAIGLKFKGKSTTKWPEGIPPRKVEFDETDTIMSHTWPFFDAKFESAEKGTNADRVKLFKGPEGASATVTRIDHLKNATINRSQENLSSKDAKKLALSVNQSRSFGKGDPIPGGPGVAAKGFRLFLPGDYTYNFELPIDSRLPETIDVDLGSVRYELEATVERSGAFRTNLVGVKEVTLIRCPAEGSLEQVEPIAISRNWEDQLHYDIVISGKSFPLGSQVPIAFKLTPLAKVQCHRIKVLVTENAEYFCSNKRVHRMEPTRKVLLFEKRADSPPTSTYPGSTMRIISGGGIPYDMRASAARGEDVTPLDSSNLLGDLESDTNIGPTEMEFSVQLPSCQMMKDKDRLQRLHFDTTYQNIQVHHWIKIVMRLSKPDPIEPGKRRHFEISIDSPFHILSCRATQANTSLPAYSSPADNPRSTSLYECGCPGAARRRSSAVFVPTLTALNTNVPNANSDASTNPASTFSPGLARPPIAHIGGPHAMQRPIHLLRAPSFNPPAFDDQEPPPPLVTPPPLYETIASPTHGLADYFARLSDVYNEDDTDQAHRLGRVDVPLTPGGRANRSMDIPREWLQVGGLAG